MRKWPARTLSLEIWSGCEYPERRHLLVPKDNERVGFRVLLGVRSGAFMRVRSVPSRVVERLRLAMSAARIWGAWPNVRANRTRGGGAP